MGQNLHLRVVKGRYVFRRRVPLAVAVIIGRRELVKSIGACQYRDAQRRARALATASDRLFMTVANSAGLSASQIDELVRSWFKEALGEAEAQLVLRRPDGEEGYQRESRYLQERAEAAQDMLKRRDWEAAVDVARPLLAEIGIAFDGSDPAHVEFCLKLLRANAELERLRGVRQAGDYQSGPTDPLLVMQAAPVTLPDGPSLAVSPTPALGEDVPMLFELTERHVASMKPIWTEQTLKQNEATFRMLKEWLGNRPVSRIGRKDVSALIEGLRVLPAKYGQMRGYREKTFQQMLKLAEREGDSVPRLTQKTINRHLSAISGLFSWAKKHGHWEGANPAEGFIDKVGADTGPKRRPFRSDELHALFTSKTWSGRGAKRDGRFWLPLLALYTGARREELAKLAVTDVREAAGVWVLDIVANAHGRVKERASNRTVPLHPALLKIGFLAHVEGVRKAGGEMLFPDFTRGGTDNKLGENFGKWFTRLLDDLDLRAPGLSFHSFRHNMGRALLAADVSEAVAAAILGHEHKTMSYRVYAAGAPVATLADALAKVDFGVDLSHLAQKANRDRR
ncbi:MAG TPA: site-specific integrase [Magnetospirillum sp.]|nr:site-specific integrase [Magnetospirillum sp.]